MVKFSARESASLLPPDFHDIRARAEARRTKDRRIRKKLGSYKSRPWFDVTGICLHQTAVEMSSTEKRWESLGAHLGITRKASVMWCHDLNRIVWHGNGWNNRCVGIEIDGRYPGVVGRPETLWNGPESPITDEIIEASKATIRWVCKYVALRGGKIEVLVAHRQSSTMRRSDPGEAIWKAVALPMMEELGLGDGGPGFEIGGYPIPEEWDPTKVGYRFEG